ncbi:indole-3-glycerol phosphate synthase TrpC [Xiashengella succiniciproducens]|jgi:indole-3-glycerol phosphate synthase|uniref:Indole-3-glycerol phosphate synthase n=1 Tax=Xiashengella succiniciproducens TaxID=2949635 RepID=A0A9J6ZSP0_9BACT|nr:indole-3-glycerol phosphate synthase TrpC [Alkaliflexus sp. Ai-910]MDI9538967.1 indole-3-glycerol phosphate synthase TrpC [Bacteroidota bacterium]URW80240.1 indole-3-glycerol phosphate synthase TrpC [Alkaliflexus sp. Ai-910]HHT99732.1 indole-3-glycerol phosphate synthase TrpC [Bacteroidales bacterium]
MNILDKIVAHKRKEVEERAERVPLKQLEYYRHYDISRPSFSKAIRESDTGIIAEFKRRSPSKGDINPGAVAAKVAPGYENAGAACMSVLTDSEFFGGNNDDLTSARDACSLPIIRKEFIIDPYQIYEARAIGASAILLIGAILDRRQTLDLATLANSLGLEVLFEIHEEKELDLLNSFIQLVGINNRNLKTFEVDIDQSMRLAARLPKEMLAVAESGISSPDEYIALREAGFKGFLMGEYFMKHSDPAAVCRDFCETVRSKITIA